MPEEISISTYIGQDFGNYRLSSQIGRGGFAEVYLGEHIYLKTQAAIKVLQTRLSSEEQERFYEEARTVAHLQHEHIVRVLEFGLKDDNIPYLVMEYAPHGTLRDRFPRGTAIPLTHILQPLKQVAGALQYAHNENLVHRDIKPENMLLGMNDEVLLSDFGIALIMKGSQRQDTQEVAGTITYMAPEQLMGRPTRASDQYALAVVVYEWLNGQRLFNGSFTAIASQHMLTPPPSLQGRVPGITATVDHTILKALAKDPQQRFASVQEFANALEAAAQGQTYNSSVSGAFANEYPAGASNTSVLQQDRLPPRRSTLTAANAMKIVLLILALLLIGGSGLAYAVLRPHQATSTSGEMQTLYTNATSGEPQINDPLRAEGTLSWIPGSTGTCLFKGGALHASNKFAALCSTTYTNFGNFAYQAEVSILQGNNGGLVFRNNLLPNPQGGIYYFSVTTQGDFSLAVRSISYINKQYSSSGLNILIKKHSTAIRTGLNQTNLLTVIARGPIIALYVNKQFVGSVKDATSLSGTIGMFSLGSSDNPVLDVAFKNVQVWTLAA